MNGEYIVAVLATLCVAQVTSIWFLVRALREMVQALREDQKLRSEEHVKALDRVLAATNVTAYSIVEATERKKPSRDRRYNVRGVN